MNGNRIGKKWWKNKRECTIPKDISSYIICNKLWMNINSCIIDVILLLFIIIISFKFDNGGTGIWFMIIVPIVMLIKDLIEIKDRRMLLIDTKGIHLMSWNHFHKRETLVEVIYKWEIIRNMYFTQQLSIHRNALRLILLTQKGKEEIDFYNLPLLNKKKLKEGIISISNRTDIFNKDNSKWF